ncbi:hypothetical protein GCM10010971_15920 [Silvimonas amylolytica]|uniref:TonB family C-terminal domain-containing protein n=2 Tax=Silvimonas amylolytica TaxID=449663 RepID=A0ABQ2PKE3_9NEIS|nr:hypothetical protein GCM10010971_15920 [Silvimonas amylolytica]
MDTPVFFTYDQVMVPAVILDYPDMNIPGQALANTDSSQELIADLYINDQGVITRVELVSSSFDTTASDYLLRQLQQIHLRAAQKDGAAVDYRMRVSYGAGVLGEVPLRAPEKPQDPLSD